MEITEILDLNPYSLPKSAKEKILNSFLNDLAHHHYMNCSKFKKMMDAIGYNSEKKYEYSELPFLPVRLFKMIDLLSVDQKKL